MGHLQCHVLRVLLDVWADERSHFSSQSVALAQNMLIEFGLAVFEFQSRLGNIYVVVKSLMVDTISSSPSIVISLIQALMSMMPECLRHS